MTMLTQKTDSKKLELNREIVAANLAATKPRLIMAASVGHTQFFCAR
jgi:hypothetical protein